MEQLRESNTLYCRAVSKVFFEISVNFTARKISERALKSTLKTGTSYGAPQVLLKVFLDFKIDERPSKGGQLGSDIFLSISIGFLIDFDFLGLTGSTLTDKGG